MSTREGKLRSAYLKYIDLERFLIFQDLKVPLQEHIHQYLFQQLIKPRSNNCLRSMVLLQEHILQDLFQH